MGSEAGPRRRGGRAGRREDRVPSCARRGRGQDGGRRRLRRGVSRRRRRARARNGRTGGFEPWSDAVIEIRPEVAEAQLDYGEAAPIVGLETTLVAHGFPEGAGLDVAIEAERAVRQAGAVPATIGVVDGQILVGLSASRPEPVSTPPPP